jgi:hypothetical protein
MEEMVSQAEAKEQFIVKVDDTLEYANKLNTIGFEFDAEASG